MLASESLVGRLGSQSLLLELYCLSLLGSQSLHIGPPRRHALDLKDDVIRLLGSDSSCRLLLLLLLLLLIQEGCFGRCSLLQEGCFGRCSLFQIGCFGRCSLGRRLLLSEVLVTALHPEPLFCQTLDFKDQTLCLFGGDPVGLLVLLVLLVLCLDLLDRGAVMGARPQLAPRLGLRIRGLS